MGLGLLACFLTGSSSFPETRPQANFSLSPALLAAAEDGDLVFRKGRGLWSPYFALLNPASGFSHVGVLVRGYDGHWGVIHAEADDNGQNGTVKLTALKDFVTDSAGFAIRRNFMPPEDKVRFTASMLAHWVRRTPFDNAFTLDDDGEKVYCSELIWVAGRSVGNYHLGDIHVLAGRGVISVDSVYHSPWLQDAQARIAFASP